MLFPRVRPGGWYVIEDWAWALTAEFQRADHPWGVFPALHPVVHKIIDLHGSRPDVVASLRVFNEFVAVERGPAHFDALSVAGWTTRRRRPYAKIALRQGRRVLGNAKRTARAVSPRLHGGGMNDAC